VKDSLSLADVKIRNLTTGQDLTPSSLTYDPNTNSAIIELGSAIITDGNYVLTIDGTGVRDATGNLVDGDVDGKAGGDFTFAFFELAGDLNRDRKVDDADRQLLVAALGTAGVRPQDGDANADGNVNFTDLVALAQNYNQSGTTLPRGDFNEDGNTDFGDLIVLAQHYNMGGRSDLNRDGIVDQKDLDLLNANFGKTLPAPAALPAALPTKDMSAPVATSLPPRIDQLFRGLTMADTPLPALQPQPAKVAVTPQRQVRPGPRPAPVKVTKPTKVTKATTATTSRPPVAPAGTFSARRIHNSRKISDLLV
jgi:hypothetical protein